ncbi:ATP-binding cassette domain-containing protein [Clostridium chrysemydis]|uniref:ATP-binding cassette domain-containing protein n=1 Tax=Clostridium chrysemydis TaxID=2665504 RepID=UPI001883C7E3|nr:ATP-binding cassette domain-containing protein [Clostridium chrysemydis]
MNAVLELKDVTKRIGKKELVKGVTFTINKGEIFGFLGPNGAGKTTTIKMITGLYKITEGHIFVDGVNVSKNFKKALKGVGAIIENPEMYGYLTGRENLKIFGRMHDNVDAKRIEEVAKLVKLGNRIDDKVNKYSLGMRQRLGVAQALLHRPKLLILDEPTNGLDPMGIKELREMLRELSETEGLSVLASSHLLSEMELMCDRFGIIDSGKIIGIKTISDIKEENDKIHTYALDISDMDKAFIVIEDIKNDVLAKMKNDKLIITFSKEGFAKVNKRLVLNDIEEYEVKVLAIRPISRWKILLSKLLALLVIGVSIVLGSVIVLLISSGSVYGFDTLKTPILEANGNSIFEVSYLGYFIKNISLSLSGLLFVTGLVFMLSTVTKNTAISVAVSMLIYLGALPITLILASNGVGGILKTFIPYIDYSIFNLVDVFKEMIVTNTVVQLSPEFGSIQLLIGFVIMSVISVIVFIKNDIKN